MQPAEDILRPESSIIMPSFDRADFAQDVEERRSRPDSGFAAVYARVVDQPLSFAELDGADGPESGAVAVAELSDADFADVPDYENDLEAAMCACYLHSDFNHALAYAKRVLADRPDHAVALLVVRACATASETEDGVFADVELTEPVGSIRSSLRSCLGK